MGSFRNQQKTCRAVLCLSGDGKEDIMGGFYLLIPSIQVPQVSLHFLLLFSLILVILLHMMNTLL